MQKIEETIWDVVVIGGGASGMMAAGRAGELGKKVLLLEKNTELGKKLLITGGGRCNLTNNELDTRKFLSKYKDSDKFLFSAFSQFKVDDTLNFFHSHGMETKLEALGRVFPASNSAKSVWETLLKFIKENNVTVASKCEVVEIQKKGNEVTSVILKDKRNIKGKSFVISTGGMSRPETGSTGDGFEWLRELGHNVEKPSVSLVPIAIKDIDGSNWVKRLQGVSITDCKITILQNAEKQSVVKGKILFTHFGVSGPTILNLSSEIGELLKYGNVEISLDILPHLDHGQLNAVLQEILKEKSNKKLKNALGELVPSAMVPIILEMSLVDGETPSHSVTRDNRLTLIDTIKNMKMEVDSLLGEDKAIITSGGISLEEVDFKTMSSKLYKNLFVTGDILNIDRPSGGYSLQLCWTSGFVAGSNA